jgi:hypothetical protein
MKGDPVRPFRLWDPYKGAYLPWRCYSNKENAHVGAFRQVRWVKSIGHTIEVIDIRTMRVIGSYTLRVGNIDIRGEK